MFEACTKRDFSYKLLVLDLLKSTAEGQGIQSVSITAMREMAGERNRLAHGHFDQNPFDGSYDVVTRNIRCTYSVERLDGLTEKADRCWDELRHASTYYVFSDD